MFGCKAAPGCILLPGEHLQHNLVVDARYEYVRENGHVESDGMLTVKGVNAGGYREIIRVDVASGEEEATWGGLF